MPGDKPRATSFILHAHAHFQEPRDVFSQIIGNQAELTVGLGYLLELLDGAGGFTAGYGDYMYQSGNIRWDLEEGMWGILRIRPKIQFKLLPL